MRKNLFIAATALVAMASCSENEVTEVATPNDNPNTIGLSTGMFATKSTVTTTNTLETVGAVSVYSDHANVPKLSFTFSLLEDKWSQKSGDDVKTWEDVTNIKDGFKVYSMFDGANVDLTDSVTNHNFTVSNDVADQKDLVYFMQKISAIPSGNAIHAIYKHALSRIRMVDATAPLEMGVHIGTASDAVKFNGFDMDGNITLNAEIDTMTWDLSALDTASRSATVSKILTSSDNSIDHDMYILPQDGKSFTYEMNSGNTPATNVEVLCWTKTKAGAPRAGWESVTAYKAENPEVHNVQVFKNGSYIDYYDAMYVKALFPITDMVKFKDAIYYNLQLNFQGTIYYAENDNYYDADGNKLTINGNETGPKPDKGEPINPDPRAPIGLTVVAKGWPLPSDTVIPK